MSAEDERLHPEGAPGIGTALGRALLGDAAFEAQTAATEQARERALRSIDVKLDRAKAINALLGLALFVVAAAAIPLLVVLWRWAL